MTTAQDVADHYDTLDTFYRDLWGEHLHHGYWSNPAASKQQAVEAMIDRVMSGLEIHAGDRVCDVGCGYGATLRYLSKQSRISGVGLSVSSKQIDFAHQQTQNADLEFRCENFLENSLPANSFDCAYAIESSEHMPDFEQFLLQMKRIVKPGKKIAIAAWLRNPGCGPLLSRFLNDKIVEEGRLVEMQRVDQFITRVAAHFRIVQFEDASALVAKTWWICVRNLVHALATDPVCRKFALAAYNKDRVFALAVPRIWLAYQTGAMRYGIIVAQKV